MERYKDKALEFVDKTNKTFLGSFYDKNYSSKEKNHGDFVTEIDLKIERSFRDFIKVNYPTHSIVGEEEIFEDKKSDWLWAIDPIDGTTNYMNGTPECAIVIGLRYRDIPVLGVCSFPAMNQLYLSESGKGSCLNGNKISSQREENLNRVLLSATYLNGPERMMAMVGDVWDSVAGIRMEMCSLAEACNVASGKVGVSILYGLGPHEWPVAYLIAKEAGCSIVSLENPNIPLDLKGIKNRNLIIAGNERLLEQVKEFVHLPPSLK